MTIDKNLNPKYIKYIEENKKKWQQNMSYIISKTQII